MSALRKSDVERWSEEQPAAAPGVRSRGPIHVAGMARAGTSWVAEMLRAAGGFVHLNEPFNHEAAPGPVAGDPQRPGSGRLPLRRRAQRRCLPAGPARHVPVPLPPPGRAAAEPLLVRPGQDGQVLVAPSPWGRCAASGRCSTTPTPRWPRRGSPSEFDGQVALLVRHPAAMVASYRKLGYRAHFRHFLDQPQLMADYLEPWRAEMEALVETDDRVAQVATFWTMLHRVLADMADRSDRLHVVRYEDLCADPVGRVRAAVHPPRAWSSTTPPGPRSSGAPRAARRTSRTPGGCPARAGCPARPSARWTPRP